MNTEPKTRKTLRKMADSKGFIFRPGRKTPTIRIWEDGTITRADVDLTLCRAMSVRDAFKLIK